MSSEARVRTALMLALAAGLALDGCADLSRGAPPSDAGADTTAPSDGAVALSFTTDVYPLLMAGCGDCHAAGGMAADTQFVLTGNAGTDAPAIRKLADLTTPASSRLLAKASGSAGHGGGTVYAVGSPEYLTLLHWIQQGASP